MPSLIEISPQDRLAITRRAIVRHMNRDNRVDSDIESLSHASENEFSRSRLMDAWHNAKQAVLIWWERHPASAVLDLANPLMREYAGSHPFVLLGVSALIGSAIVFVKPWRMMSVGSWLLAALKSSGMTSAVVSLLTKPGRKSQASYS